MSARKRNSSTVANCKYCDPSPIPQAIFARRFPGVDLLHFHAHRKGRGYTRDFHNLTFEGPIELILRMGLAAPHMIAPAPKRNAHAADHDDDRSVGSWYTYRRSKGRVEVHRELQEDFDRTHPLAVFGTWRYPICDTPQERREVLRAASTQWRDQEKRSIQTMLRFIARSPDDGFRVDATTAAKIGAVVSRTEGELLTLFDSARVLNGSDGERPALQVIAGGRDADD